MAALNPLEEGVPLVLPPDLQDLYDHVVHVLENHLDCLRKIPLTGDAVEETVQCFAALEALVTPMKIPQYDTATAKGRLLEAIARLNREIPGVALRTLWQVHEFLATSDDDGIMTRQKGLAIIQGLGTGDSSVSRVLSTFPSLP